MIATESPDVSPEAAPGLVDQVKKFFGSFFSKKITLPL
jgi:hypothetical protein